MYSNVYAMGTVKVKWEMGSRQDLYLYSMDWYITKNARAAYARAVIVGDFHKCIK